MTLPPLVAQACGSAALATLLTFALDDPVDEAWAVTAVLLGAYRDTATVGGGIKPTRESFQLQLGMTWRLGNGLYLEPTAAFSLGGAAPDFSLSINLPFSF